MLTWNFDISQAPRGRDATSVVDTPKGQRMVTRFVPDKVILATKCGKVTLSHYLPDEERWLMLGKGEQPVAWFAWPEHPHSLSNPVAATNSAGADSSSPASAGQLPEATS